MNLFVGWREYAFVVGVVVAVCSVMFFVACFFRPRAGGLRGRFGNGVGISAVERSRCRLLERVLVPKRTHPPQLRPHKTQNA